MRDEYRQLTLLMCSYFNPGSTRERHEGIDGDILTLAKVLVAISCRLDYMEEQLGKTQTDEHVEAPELESRIVNAKSESELGELIRTHEDTVGKLSSDEYRLASAKLDALRVASKWAEEAARWRRAEKEETP